MISSLAREQSMLMYSNFSLLLLIYFDKVKTQFPWFLSMPLAKVVGNFKAQTYFVAVRSSLPLIVYRRFSIPMNFPIFNHVFKYFIGVFAHKLRTKCLKIGKLLCDKLSKMKNKKIKTNFRKL